MPFEIAIISACVSGLSLFVAITSLVMTYRQRGRQDRFALRKGLTDIIEGLVDANMEFAKLPYGINSTPEGIEMRRIINERRRYLTVHGDILIQEIPDLASDLDYNVLARGFQLFDLARAEEYWQLCVTNSPSPLARAMNSRGHARYLYVTGRRELGRQLFQQALTEAVGDDDRGRRNRADTYSNWCLVERDYGSLAEALRLYKLAQEESSGIFSLRERTDVDSYLKSAVFADFHLSIDKQPLNKHLDSAQAAP